MRYITLTLGLLWASLSFQAAVGSPVLEGNEIYPRGRPTRVQSHCPPVTITTTIHKPRTTFVSTYTSTPKKCSTTVSTTTTSSNPPACTACGNCEPPSAIPVTRTLDWEDIDGTVASRVPIPDNYHGFSHYNPDQNKVYRSGPPHASVGNGRQVAYANDGKFGLGAQGFVIQIKSFWILTFLDPANGIYSATLRVSGQQVSSFIIPITVDRTWVQIVAPLTQSNTAVGFFIEVFAGDSTDGQRLAFWIDDFVYVRNLWPASCCQAAGTPLTLDFNDVPDGTSTPPSPYHGFSFPGVWAIGTYADFPELGKALTHSDVAQPGSITSPSTFTLTRLTLLIKQGVQNTLGQDSHIVATITGHGPNGEQYSFGWTIESVIWQDKYVKLDLGGDWTQDGSGPATGYFESTGGFKNINELRITVQEVTASGPGPYQPFGVDNIEYQPGC